MSMKFSYVGSEIILYALFRNLELPDGYFIIGTGTNSFMQFRINSHILWLGRSKFNL
jgi:hypothetical protein